MDTGLDRGRDMFAIRLGHRLHDGTIDGGLGLDERAIDPFGGVIVRIGVIGSCRAARCGGASATAQQQPENHGERRAPFCSTVSQNETSPPDFATPVWRGAHCLWRPRLRQDRVKTQPRDPVSVPYWLPEAMS